MKEHTAPFGFLLLQAQIEHGEVNDGIILDMNPAFELLSNLSKDSACGQKASEVFPPFIRDSFNWLAFFGGVIRSGNTQETLRWVELYKRYYIISVIPSDDNILAVITRSTQKSDAFAWWQSHNLPMLEEIEGVLDKTHDAILLIEYNDGVFRCVRNNEMHKRLTGFTNIAGATIKELIGEEIGAKLEQYYEECIRTSQKVTYEQSYFFAPGNRIFHTDITPVLSKDGKRYLLSASKDITELKAAQQEKQLMTKRLNSMFELHDAIMLLIEPMTGFIVDANPAATKFYGYTKEELLQLKISDINMLPPEEVKRYRVLALEQQQRYFVFPHRLKSGEIRLVDVYSCPLPDEERPLLYSIIFDVTDRETYRNELFREKELLRTTLWSIGDGVITADSTGRITSLNVIAQELTGYKSYEAEGKLFSEIFVLRNEDTGHPVENPIKKVLETGRIIGLANHTVLVNRYGEAIPVADSAAPIRTEAGEIFGVVMVFRDVSNEKEQSKQIRFLSYHDSLTGLYNRRYIEEILDSIDIMDNIPISVIMGDVNGLKITNDVFGHAKGDELLQHVAKSFQKNCRDTNLIARWGGDEFVVFMPRTHLPEAEEVIARIREDYLHVDEGGLRLSISLGCAAKTDMSKTIHAVMREAEEYMYHQKLLDSKSYRNTIINTLLATIYEKSIETEEHAKRMEVYCHSIGRKLYLSSKEMDELSLLAILHDIGKVGINPNILQKPGSLTLEEWEEMKRHPEIGFRIAQTTPELAMVADFILCHHERWDGAGYPRGLKGEDIPLACRILSVTDAYDAMTNDRIYRCAMSRQQAIDELLRNANRQFDPHIVSIFVDMLQTNSFSH